MTPLVGLQQVCHITEILRSGKVLLHVDGVIGEAYGRSQLQRRPFRLPCRCLSCMHTSALAFACCHYLNGSRATITDNELLAHEVTQPYKAFPRI